MKKVYILGAGPSLKAFEEAKVGNNDSVIMINEHNNTVQNKKIVEKLKGKNVYIMCNIGQKGFSPEVFSKIEIKGCLTNRLKPDWDLWQIHKDKQKKNFEGGTLNNLGRLPCIAEDEPYLYSWRGPSNRNLVDMSTYDGRKIEHMPDAAEQYLIPITKEKLIGNCSYYASLYALLNLKAEHIVYYGLDFYNNIEIKKSWYLHPPTYNTLQWWNMRVRYEGEHMKVLYDNYLSKFFPSITLEFFTTINDCFKSSNIICNTLNFKNANIVNQTWYSSGYRLT